MYRKIMHRITTDAVLVIAVMCVLAACGSDRTDTFTSPNGTNTIRIVYDEASRPSLFYHDEKIWEYPNSGFNQEAYFYVEWESENTVILKYDDAGHDGKYAEEYRIELTQAEGLVSYFDSITVEMLDACNEMPSLDSYQNDSLVLLNWYDEAVRLYGISEDENTAMLLYVQGEKLLIDKPYRNNHISYPKLNVTDADNDGHDEIFISRETMTGSPGHWYELLVCDYEDEWIIRDYTDYVEDLEAYIGYKFDETSKTFTFMRNDDGTVLLEASMPDWTEEYPYTGDVNYADYIRFDAETMQMEVSLGICMENSLPYHPIELVFDVRYEDGEFDIDLSDYKSDNSSDSKMFFKCFEIAAF